MASVIEEDNNEKKIQQKKINKKQKQVENEKIAAMVFLQSGKEEKTSPFQKIIDKSQGYECCYVQKGRGKVLKTHGKGQADQRG